jgi:hypothetical protein
MLMTILSISPNVIIDLKLGYHGGNGRCSQKMVGRSVSVDESMRYHASLRSLGIGGVLDARR